MRQLAGMRGDGEAVGRDHRDADHFHFKEGLSVIEYFNRPTAPQGSRGYALKTRSGYLTRRLVDVAQDCIIRPMTGPKLGSRCAPYRSARSSPRWRRASSAVPTARIARSRDQQDVVKRGTLMRRPTSTPSAGRHSGSENPLALTAN